ncbi:predicted protein [Aspergillus terreus NIH2624]|uniref:Uncharacterized protein n=1 Tax=Aspergillus terreus (strain NIH 2624 / FGSC A1156) TaxID=341663 RepID=Q0C813_ASPTN|nr:uncharacterized protein ATEG_10171 [Aspergillus terreus NIH2624]EAU29620.1 predicted protein [Aspergillus terreus NIH2624]
MCFHVVGITCHHVARRGLNEQGDCGKLGAKVIGPSHDSESLTIKSKYSTPQAALIDIETIETQLSSELSRSLPPNIPAPLLVKSQRTQELATKLGQVKGNV